MINRGQPCWDTALRMLLEKVSPPEFTNLNATLPLHKNFMTKIKQKLYKDEELRIMNEIQMCEPETKLRTYKLFKVTSDMEPYLISNPRLSYIHAIARFRISSHTLEIENISPYRGANVQNMSKQLGWRWAAFPNRVFGRRYCTTKESATAITYISNYNTLNNQEKFIEILTNRETDMITETMCGVVCR